ncbi:MAG TPA: hypothetical protein VMW50_03555 [Dehalococcoidia bacterium]|nr:hypothetical protein [Dehalococcoidia bacterium]
MDGLLGWSTYSLRFCGWWIRSGRTSEWALVVIATNVRVLNVWN